MFGFHPLQFRLLAGIIMEMDDMATKWLYAFAHKNFWRVAAWYDFDDLIQDGQLYYYKIVARYTNHGERYRRRKHIMRLFQVSLVNHVNTLSKKKTLQTEDTFSLFLTSPDDTEDRLLERHDAIDTGPVILAGAPNHVKSALVAIVNDLRRLKMPYRRYANGTRETTNQRLCRIAGLDPQRIDLVDELKYYLTD